MPLPRLQLPHTIPVLRRIVRYRHRSDLIADFNAETHGEDAGAAGGRFEECILCGSGREVEATEAPVGEAGRDVSGDGGRGARDGDVEAFGGEAEFAG